MRVLGIKMLRDLGRLWVQALAVALVMACGVATLILAVGAYRSLEETREAYYDRYRFGHVFAQATRAPLALERRIAALRDVAAVEARIMKPVLLDVEGMSEPATGMAISVPDRRALRVNRLYLRRGRLPGPGRLDEVAVNERFAAAHGFDPGARFEAILDGTKRSLTITGTVLSPEFVYAMSPGDLVPDDRRFALLFMSEDALAGAFDLAGAFNAVSLRLLPGTSERAVIESLDDLLAPYGGTGAYGRKDQMSNAFLDGELTQLKSMARYIPLAFLLVAAFLIHMVLGRLIALEREQIGLLKALGYGRLAIGWHYLEFVFVIAAAGIVMGFIAGTWLGRSLTRLYAEFYSFPFLIFRQSAEIYGLAAAVSLVFALAGGVRAVQEVLALPAAVAMQPPAPSRYRRLPGEAVGLLKPFSQLTVMALRHLVRRPVRAFFTSLGISLAGALLVVASFTVDSVTFMIDAVFFRADRQDASILFASPAPPRALQAVARLPGVLRAEPFRALPVVLRNGQRHRRLTVFGKTDDMRLSRILDPNLRPIVPAAGGLAIGERVAELLDLRIGNLVEVETLEGRRRRLSLPVVDVVQSYLGLTVFATLETVDRLAGGGPRLSGVNLALDVAQLDRLYGVVKNTPVLGGIALQRVSLAKFRQTMKRNIEIMTTVYTTLAVIIAVGVVYNSARIQLSERARELASLRVLGFRRGEVSKILLIELGLIVAAAQPLAWAIGYGFAWSTALGFESDLFRIPFVIEQATFARASLVVLIAAAASALIVRRRVDRLDLIQVLKTRE